MLRCLRLRYFDIALRLYYCAQVLSAPRYSNTTVSLFPALFVSYRQSIRYNPCAHPSSRPHNHPGPFLGLVSNPSHLPLARPRLSHLRRDTFRSIFSCPTFDSLHYLCHRFDSLPWEGSYSPCCFPWLWRRRGRGRREHNREIRPEPGIFNKLRYHD